jgi:uncharacterized protein
VVTPERILRDWRPRSVEELEARDLEALVALGAEIVLIGTGAVQRFPAPEVLAPLRGRRIGVEVMDTAAACRTYNILVAEGRSAAAVIFPITDI